MACVSRDVRVRSILEELARGLGGISAGKTVSPLELRDGPTIYHDATLDDIVGLFREVIVANCYQPRDFYRPRPGDVVLDIGANIGVFALSLQRGRGGVRVHSFEPASGTRGRLIQNVEKNGLGGLITPHPEAISATSAR